VANTLKTSYDDVLKPKR